AGDRLVIELHNTGDDTHDLVLETGARTDRIAPGKRATLDAGVVGRDLDGWRSVVGHRQMGMVFAVRVTGGDDDGRAAGAQEHGTAHDHTGSAPDGDGTSAADAFDPMAEPADGFTARDARLPSATGPRLHKRTL